MFDPIYIQFNDWEYKISPDQYVHRSNTTHGVEICSALVVHLSRVPDPTIILGAPFIRNYYIYHDMENKRVGVYGDYMIYVGPAIFKKVIITFSVTAMILIHISICIWFCLRFHRAKANGRQPYLLEYNQEPQQIELNSRG